MSAQATATESDDPILQRIRSGDLRGATTLCVQTHGAAIGRLCMAMLGAQGDAEEAAQETFVAAHRSFTNYRGDGSLRSWLNGIARRVCARRLETQSRRDRKLRLVYDAETDGSLPDVVLERRRRASRVREALEQLKPSERDAVVLRYEAGLDYREIAQVCEIDEAAARKRVSRALGRLRGLLSSGERT